MTLVPWPWINFVDDVVEAHATALNWTVTFLSIHVAKTDVSETFRPRGSSSVTNNIVTNHNVLKSVFAT